MLGFTPLSTVPISSVDSSAGAGVTALTDSLVLTDVFTPVVIHNWSDTLVLTDAMVLTRELQVGLSDTLTLTDEILIINFGNILFEHELVLTDNLSIHYVPYTVFEHDIILEHELSATVFPAQYWSDNIGLTDTMLMTRHRVVDVILCDLVILADSFKRTHSESLDDTLTITDATNDGNELRDTLLLSDNLSSNAIYSLCTSTGYVPNKVLENTITITDTLSFNSTRGIILTDVLTVRDAMLIYKV